MLNNAQDAFRQADDAAARAARRYASALARAHRQKRSRLDLEAAYVAEIAAEVRRARALKRMMTE